MLKVIILLLVLPGMKYQLLQVINLDAFINCYCEHQICVAVLAKCFSRGRSRE